jgi:type VI secretion system protein ImpH
MGTADWRTGEPLASRLRSRPASFDFYQWVRLASWPTRAVATTDVAVRGARLVGPQLRFRGEMSAAFPGSEISSGPSLFDARRGVQKRRTELFVSNFVLSGVLGPLPDSFAEWVRQRLTERDPAMAEFLDIFNHRVSTLRYELKAASVAAFDALRPEQTHYAEAVGALMGLAAFEGDGAGILSQRVPIPKRALLALAGLVIDGRKSAAVATVILGVYLQSTVKIEELVGAWRQIEPRDQTRLGQRRLIDTAPLGRRIWVNHAAVGLTIGPVNYARLCTLLVNCVKSSDDTKDDRFGAGYLGLASMLLYLFDRHVDVVVTLIVEEAGIPPALLWRPRRVAGFGSSYGLRLGQTAWLRGTPKTPRHVRFTVRINDLMDAA